MFHLRMEEPRELIIDRKVREAERLLVVPVPSANLIGNLIDLKASHAKARQDFGNVMGQVIYTISDGHGQAS